MEKKTLTETPLRECLVPIGNPPAPSAGADGRPGPQSRPAIVPFFLPFAGCPHRCLFCAQDKQTGTAHDSGSLPYPEALANLLSDLERLHAASATAQRPFRPVELAFYGGTFTALPERLQTDCMRLAAQAKAKGILCRIRCSTRPDAVAPQRLADLKRMGLDTVELGVQSFHSEALRLSERGYTGETAREGCRRVRESGLELGIQLLPGMPGSTPQGFLDDVRESLAFSPTCLRFYPCLVVEGTPLAALWKAGGYRPWDMETTVGALGAALAAAWERRVPVIRLSLAPEPELDDAVLAGPRHPALGNIIQGEALLRTFRDHIARNGGVPPSRVSLPRSCQGFFYGHRGRLVPFWKELGVAPASIDWIPGDHAVLRWEDAGV